VRTKLLGGGGNENKKIQDFIILKREIFLKICRFTYAGLKYVGFLENMLTWSASQSDQRSVSSSVGPAELTSSPPSGEGLSGRLSMSAAEPAEERISEC